MESWELLIGTISGFLIAFFSEPIKIYFTNKTKKRQLRESLYKEFIQVYSDVFYIIEQYESKGIRNLDHFRENMKNISTTCYKFSKKDPLIFYELKEAIYIDKIYRNFITSITQIPPKKDLNIVPEIDPNIYLFFKNTLLCFDENIKNNNIERKLLIRVCKDCNSKFSIMILKNISQQATF